MVEVDPTSPVVGAAGEVPLIETFQEPVAAVCVEARRRVGFRTLDYAAQGQGLAQKGRSALTSAEARAGEMWRSRALQIEIA
jgi:hypothetical protein